MQWDWPPYSGNPPAGTAEESASTGRDICGQTRGYLPARAEISPDKTLKKQKIDKQWKDTYQTVFM